MTRFRYVYVIALALMLSASTFATEYMFMGFDQTTQKMQAVVRGDTPFHAVITYEQSNPGGYIGDISQVPINPTEQWGEAELAPVDPNRMTDVPDGTMNVITATAELFNDNDEYLGTLVTTDTLYADVDGFTGIYTYPRDFTPVLPDTIRAASAFCAYIGHGTYRIPIECDFPSEHGDYPDPADVEVYVENGCQTEHCVVDTCTPIDWNLFTWNIRSRPGCIISLIMTYCDGDPGCICIWRSDEDLPVAFTGFSAVAGDGRVSLQFGTASESDLNMFKITRSERADDPASWRVVATIPARNLAGGANYSWIDEQVANGVTYYYKLQVIDEAMNSSVYNVDGDVIVRSATPTAGTALPEEFRLDQNFPNPFNSQTTFAFSIPMAEHVTLKVFDIMGREVATVVDRELQPNHYTINWTAEGLSTGVYMYTLTAGNFTQSRKLLYLK